MVPKNDSWKLKYESLVEEIDLLRIAYNNLLNDVLSFNEIISKKEQTVEILTLVLRLARTIIDFESGIVLKYEDFHYEVVHSINLNNLFQDFIDRSLELKYYDLVVLKREVCSISIGESTSRLIVPLITKQKVVGVMDLLVNEPESNIVQQDKDLLWVLSSIASIEFASLDMTNRSNLLGLLLSSLEKINSEDNLENLLNLILNNLKQIVQASSFTLILKDRVLSLEENLCSCLGYKHSQGTSCKVYQDALTNKTLMFIKKTNLDPNCSSCDAHVERGGSLIIVPLFKGEETFGVISIFDEDKSGEVFSEYNRYVIEIFAKQVTIALNNALIYDKLRTSNEEFSRANNKLFRQNIELDAKKGELIIHQERLQKAYDEVSKWKSIVSKELDTAGLIQLATMSKTDNPKSIDFHVEYRPHHSIGGDYFGIIKIEEGRTFVYIGDVSGKGVPAAITTGFLKNEFSFMINSLNFSAQLSPSKVLSMVNSSSLKVFEATEQFTSAWCGIIDTNKNKLIYSSAGHDYPLIIKGNEILTLDGNNGPIMGIYEDYQYEEIEMDFEKGLKLVLYTDGITDQEIAVGERLGRNWLVERLGVLKEESPKVISSMIVEEMLLKTSQMPQHDDILLITIAAK